MKAPPLGVGFWSIIAHEFLAQGQGFAALLLKGEVFTPSKNSLELSPGGGEQVFTAGIDKYTRYQVEP